MTELKIDRCGSTMPLAWCLIAVAASGLSCSGSEEDAGPYESRWEGPTSEEGAAFLSALREVESSRTDTGGSTRVLFFEDTSLRAAWDTARWEVPALKSWPEFNEQLDSRSWSPDATTASLTAIGNSSSPQEALLEAMDAWVEVLGGADYVDASDPGESSYTSRISSQASLGPFEYEWESVIRDIVDGDSYRDSLLVRRRISRAGQSYSSETKSEVTDSAEEGGFYPKADGLELTDIVRGLIEHSAPPTAFSFIFLSSDDGDYIAYLTGADQSKTK